eukprot:6719922-Karenia_brevis.AAC.1
MWKTLRTPRGSSMAKPVGETELKRALNCYLGLLLRSRLPVSSLPERLHILSPRRIWARRTKLLKS